jgi:hypothetical protein
MARQRNAPVLSPSLPPERGIPILERLIADAEQLLHEYRHSTKRQEWTNTTEAALQAALGSANPAIDAFSLAQCGAYSRNDSKQRLQTQANDQLRCIARRIVSVVVAPRCNTCPRVPPSMLGNSMRHQMPRLNS